MLIWLLKRELVVSILMTIAKLYDAMLITDGEPMAIYAERISVDTILIRRINKRELIAKIDKLTNN